MAAMHVNHIVALIASKKITPEVCLAKFTLLLCRRELDEQAFKEVQLI